ncbi:uncharacterized protein LOC111709551 [Eurytemora carolleeae]|uniref:uncharacterized protein LOC111709551 n=1 Tax=Eurytemora carolleeae TaxID=1294199 RepID=UPI000C75BB0F|nr:uncharacterized protein LOC111709551 [Eurytemora carolleeae]|eukprot:XP_023339047.1 uncharacterized protein LOC111709551 [Eurytemora affinis]
MRSAHKNFIAVLLSLFLIYFHYSDTPREQSSFTKVKATGQEKKDDMTMDLLSLEQDDPQLVEYVKNNLLIKTGSSNGKDLNLTNFPPVITGQYNQAVEVDKLFNSSLHQGFFIEAGGYDGETFSNTLFFELQRKWTGLLVEANSGLFQTLKGKNRNIWISPGCLSLTSKPINTEFETNDYLGGIVGDEQDLALKSTEQKTCIPLYTLLLALGNPTVHYFSLDIEGAELKVLKTIPWKLVDIWLVGIEACHMGDFDKTESRKDMIEFMEKQGYKLIGTIGVDDIFIKPDKISVTEDTIVYLKSLMIKEHFNIEDQNL